MSSIFRALVLLFAIAAPAAAQVSGPPFVFVAGTVINPDEVNTNFSTVYDGALNRFGGTVEGHLLWSPDSTFDIGASGATRPRDLFLGRNALIGGTLGVTGASTLAALSATTGSFSSTLAVTGAATLTSTLAVNSSAAAAIDVAGGITAGSGNVAVIGTDGRIPAISSTYFASLSGANLTGLLEANIADGTVFPRLTANELFTGSNRFSGSVEIGSLSGVASAGTLTITSTGLFAPIQFYSSGNAANEKYTQLVHTGTGGVSVRFWNDAVSANLDPFVIERSGVTSATVRLNAALALPNITTVTGLNNGNNNNLNPSGLSTAATLVITSAGGSTAITGITAQANGRQLRICAEGAVTLNHADANSSAANRLIIFGGTASITNGCTMATYDTSADGGVGRWRLDAW